jgi:hypothetical protein
MFVSKQKKKGRSCNDRNDHRLGDTSDIISINSRSKEIVYNTKVRYAIHI